MVSLIQFKKVSNFKMAPLPQMSKFSIKFPSKSNVLGNELKPIKGLNIGLVKYSSFMPFTPIDVEK